MSKTKLKWGEEPQTEYLNQLNNIAVTILSAPTMEEIMSYIPEFVMATWEDTPGQTQINREETVDLMFKGKTLPTAMETIRITFRVDGLDLVDVTHLIRHRVFSFSAQCTGDRDMRLDSCMVKPAIIDSGYMSRYKKIVDDAKQLYADMVDGNQVSIFDARTILPRSLSSFYYVSGNIKDIIGFIQMRKDEAIQPESDNIFAIRLYQELVKLYPVLEGIIEFGGRDEFWCKTAAVGHSTLCYRPKEANRFDGCDDLEYIYDKTRDDFPGEDTYSKILKEVL